jgi:hypothetical protein
MNPNSLQRATAGNLWKGLRCILPREGILVPSSITRPSWSKRGSTAVSVRGLGMCAMGLAQTIMTKARTRATSPGHRGRSAAPVRTWRRL